MIFNNNIYPASGADLLYRCKEFLKTNVGWTHQASSDTSAFTTTPGNGNDKLTTAAKMGTNTAWGVYADPAGKQWLMQCRSTLTPTRIFRMKFSASAGFVASPLNASSVATGSIGLTTPPSAADQVIFNGTVDDTTANVGIVTTFPADGTFRLHGFAETVAPYGFCFWAVSSVVPSPVWMWMCDPMAYGPSGDPDPWVVHYAPSNAANAADFFITSNATVPFTDEVSAPYAGFKRTTGGGMQRCPALYWGVGPSEPTGMLNTFGPDNALPVCYGRRNTLSGYGGFKGVSKYFRWRVTTHSAMETMSLTTGRDRVVLNEITVPWDGTVPLF